MTKWYYLDPDNRKDPKGMHCARCKRSVKDTQAVESFLNIIIHPVHPWYRLAGAMEKSTEVIGERCHKKMMKEYGEMQ